MSAISVRWLSISWGAVIFETNYGLMQHSHFEIKNKLLNALDEDYNVVDMATVCEIVTILEKTPITPKILEDTRLGKVINEFRRKTENEVLAKRAKDLVRRWRHLMLKDGGSIEKSPSFHQNGGGSSNSTLTNNSDPITDCSSSSVVSYSEQPTKRRRSNKLAGFCNNNSNNVSSNDDDSQSCNMDRENYNISNNNFSNNNNSSNNRRHRNHNNNNNNSSSHNSHNSDDFSSNSSRLWDNGSADVTILDHHQESSSPHHHGPETDDAVPKTHVSNKRMRKRAADDPMDDYYREPRAKKSKLNGVSNRLQFTKTRKNGDNFDNYVVSNNNNNNNHQITNCTPITTTTTTTTMVEEEPDRTIDDTVMVEKKTHRRHHRRSNRYEDTSSHSSSRYDVGRSRNEENTDNNWYEDNGHHHSQYEDTGGGHNSQYEDLDNSRYEDDDVDIDSSRNEDIDNSVLLTAAISPVISVTNNNNNNNNVPAAFSSTVPYNTTADIDIDIVVEDSGGGVPTTSAASSVTETSSRKKRSSKKKENKKYHYDNIIKEKLLVMAKTGKVKTTKELVNNLKHQESSTTIDETSLSRLPPSSTSTAAVHQEVQYDKHDDDSRQIPNPDQDSSITRDVVEQQQHLLPASSVSAITSNECLQQLIPSTGSSNNRSKDHRHRHKRVVQKSDDPIENEIVTLLSKLPPLDVDSIVWSSDEDGEHDDDEVLAEFEINAKADLLNSDEAVEGVTGNFDHRDMRFKEWQDVVARKTANDEFITVLPYTVVD